MPGCSRGDVLLASQPLPAGLRQHFMLPFAGELAAAWAWMNMAASCSGLAWTFRPLLARLPAGRGGHHAGRPPGDPRETHRIARHGGPYGGQRLGPAGARGSCGQAGGRRGGTDAYARAGWPVAGGGKSWVTQATPQACHTSLAGDIERGRYREVAMGREPDDQAVERLLGERGQHLMRAAVALTGSRVEGEDLLQAALERLLHNWARVDTDLEGYLRRILYNLAADGWRRRGRWRGRLAEFRSQAGADRTGSDDVAVVDLRDMLVRLLQQLPPRQRAVLVLRYWEQRTEAETADLLGCTEGTVKSAAARGLRRLRELAGPGAKPQGAPVLKKAQLRTDLKVAGGRS